MESNSDDLWVHRLERLRPHVKSGADELIEVLLGLLLAEKLMV
jgi:hypothetical protein